MDACLW